MASPAVTAFALPSEAELQSFARVAAHLLTEQQRRAVGSRIVRRTAGIGIQHLDHRDYVPGDEVRHIDWRQTARRRRPIVRRFESESASDWTILLDASSSMVVPAAAKWHAASLLAAAMSYALLELGHRVALVAFGTGIVAECQRGRGQHHYPAIVRLLTRIRPARAGECSDLGACAKRLHDGPAVLVISDFLGHDQMRGGLAAVLERCRSLHAVQVNDPRETNLAYTGDVDLVDVETGLRMPIRADESASAAAAAARGAMTQRLRSFCTRSGIAFTDWSVSQPWQQMLVSHFVQARSMC
jgi:uncharacterized protein (DUF58 family)